MFSGRASGNIRSFNLQKESGTERDGISLNRRSVETIPLSARQSRRANNLTGAMTRTLKLLFWDKRTFTVSNTEHLSDAT